MLLITSRDTGRWVIPKGWPSQKLSDWHAARREVWEEAGVRVTVWPEPIGTYDYAKRTPAGEIPMTVDVYLMICTKVRDRWPERKERRRAWVSLAEAAERVVEPNLKALLRTVERSVVDTAGVPVV